MKHHACHVHLDNRVLYRYAHGLAAVNTYPYPHKQVHHHGRGCGDVWLMIQPSRCLSHGSPQCAFSAPAPDYNTRLLDCSPPISPALTSTPRPIPSNHALITRLLSRVSPSTPWPSY
ncbi:hypothetical protein COCSADRAFT_262494 [Bipolaris sorokiniana ND90Pr]|uniref:Uncharacterized protein n=1 Tax=Cochliobolus sativus (strain ND90Pr / ATCC 201652) TaxID=665912 RepID=M2S8V1_COCSN|nr:uncharacterized protein COCSADRAFT_262494 [Bipolaris sorokiniana ND90Pr]EMD58990.1 hypothetical protein COCSADRAFT_262494 [Bipolaris sorokiniana ND90Pr]